MATIKRNDKGEITEVIKRTAHHGEETNHTKLLALFEAQVLSEDDKPKVSDIPFKVSGTELRLAWSQYTLELQTADDQTTDSKGAE
jgi:hypothetical protein